MSLSSLVMIILVAMGSNGIAREKQPLVEDPTAQKRGGEHVTKNGTPARKAEKAQRTKFDPRSLEAYIQFAKPTVDATKQKVPGYGQIMEEVFTKKSWYYTDTKLSCPYMGQQDLGAESAICQDELEVTVYWPYFNPNSPQTNMVLEDQGYALIHEMNRHAGMLKNKSDAAIVNVDDAIENNLSEQDLVRALSVLGFGEYATGSEISSLKQDLSTLIQGLYSAICLQNNSSNTVSKVVDKQELLINRMEKTPTRELRQMIYRTSLLLSEVSSTIIVQGMANACNLLSQ